MKINLKEIIFIIFLFLFTFSLRFYRLSETSLYPDEITWMVRARETALAVRTLDFEFFKSAWWNIKHDTEAIALPLTISTGVPMIYLAKDASVLSANLYQDYIVARTTIILFVSLFLVIFYFSVKKLTNTKIAVLSSLLLTLDPVFMANSKLIMNDVYLSIFVSLAIFSFLLIKNNYISALLSGLFVALSFLTKPTGLIVLPILLLDKSYKKLLVTLLVTLLLITILWPASWYNPLFAIPEYLLRQRTLVGAGINNYFFGQITNNPSFLYYIYQFVSRIPIVIVSSFILSVIYFWTEIKKSKLVTLLIFILLYIIILSMSSKKLGVRYLLPIIPFAYVFASKFLAKFNYIIIAPVMIYFVANYLLLFPHHDLYYNQLFGGMKHVTQYDLVGLCSGSKESVDYILKCFPQVKSIGAIGCGNSVIPYYYPNHFDNGWKEKDVFYVEQYYLQLNKDTELTKYVQENKPTKVISINGVNLSYIYVNSKTNNLCQSK